MQKWIEIIKQFIKFGLVGVSNTLISLGVYYIFIFIDSDLYLLGNIVGFGISVINAYYWNSKHVFKSGSKSKGKQFIKSVIAYGSTALLSTFLLFLMVQKLGVSDKVAPLINLLITVPLNFLLNRFWTFKNK